MPSSKTCNRCGWIKKDLTLKDRTFICEQCGAILDRDLNAATNIQNAGTKILTDGEEFTPVESVVCKIPRKPCKGKKQEKECLLLNLTI